MAGTDGRRDRWLAGELTSFERSLIMLMVTGAVALAAEFGWLAVRGWWAWAVLDALACLLGWPAVISWAWTRHNRHCRTVRGTFSVSFIPEHCPDVDAAMAADPEFRSAWDSCIQAAADKVTAEILRTELPGTVVPGDGVLAHMPAAFPVPRGYSGNMAPLVQAASDQVMAEVQRRLNARSG